MNFAILFDLAVKLDYQRQPLFRGAEVGRGKMLNELSLLLRTDQAK